jgi:hypothetical protein
MTMVQLNYLPGADGENPLALASSSTPITPS